MSKIALNLMEIAASMGRESIPEVPKLSLNLSEKSSRTGQVRVQQKRAKGFELLALSFQPVSDEHIRHDSIAYDIDNVAIMRCFYLPPTG